MGTQFLQKGENVICFSAVVLSLTSVTTEAICDFLQLSEFKRAQLHFRASLSLSFLLQIVTPCIQEIQNVFLIPAVTNSF